MKMFFAADSDIDLWPHFKKHHESLGFTQFYCSGTNTPLVSRDNLFVFHHTRDENLPYFRSLQRAYFKMIADNIVSTEWYGISELDEFHEYHLSLLDLIGQAVADGCNVVRAELVDKVAPGGLLPPLDSRPITEQFPFTSQISKRIMKACDEKVVLLQGKHEIHGGNHSVTEQGVKYYPHKQTVNHYKWHANVLKRIEERVTMPTDEGHGWLEGNRKVLDYWNKNRTVLVL